jgi:hypothetical protein
MALRQVVAQFRAKPNFHPVGEKQNLVSPEIVSIYRDLKLPTCGRGRVAQLDMLRQDGIMSLSIFLSFAVLRACHERFAATCKLYID